MGSGSSGSGTHLTRLLLVDNSTDYVDSLRDQLLREGWSAEVAYSEKEAEEKVLEKHYQLCILDKRLRDDRDEKDRSGLDLVPKLWQLDGLLHFFLLTAFPDFSEANRLLSGSFLNRENRCKGYLPKEDGVERLILELDRVEKEALALNRGFDLHQVVNLDEVLEPLLREDLTREEIRPRLIEELELLLRTIFVPEKEYPDLRFALLEAQGRSGARMLSVSTAAGSGWVLKLASRLAVEEEWYNYKEHLKVIQHRPEIAPTMCQVSSHLGAIVYSRVQEIRPEDRLRNLLEFLLDLEVEIGRVETAIRDILLNSRPWFTRARRTAVWDLTAYYAAHFHLEDGEVLERFQGLSLGHPNLQTAAVLEGGRFGGTVMNPLPFFARARFLIESQWNICHGDLTVSNVLMPEGIPWMIDFASTGPGPAALDWVTLETSLKFEYPWAWESPPEAWFQFETALVLQRSLDDPPIPPAGLPPDLARLFQAVVALRTELGRQGHIRGGMLEYLVGLFYATLFNIRSFWPKKYKQKSRNDKAYRLLASAGLIGERLAGFGVNRTDLEILYSWQPSGEPGVALYGSRPATQDTQLEARQIARERLLYQTLNQVLGRRKSATQAGAAPPLAERYAELGKLRDEVRALSAG